MSSTYAIGPDNGQLLINTGREGLAARAGHDLAIAFDEWSGTVSDDGGQATVAVTVNLTSLRVVDSTTSPGALSDEDRGRIASNAAKALDSAQFPEASFTATSAERSDEGGVLAGELDLHGVCVPLRLAVTRDASSWRAAGSLHQTAFGIKPFSAMAGALKLADEVRIEARVTLAPA